MKRNLFIFVSTCLLVVQTASSQVIENFNTRNNIALTKLKGYLQNHCWTISGFDISRSGPEENGSLISGTETMMTEHSGIYTPVLDVPDHMDISFTWQFNQPIQQGARRWLKIFLTDGNNTIVTRLDSFECSGITASTSYTYKKSFTGIHAGIYKVFLNYQGTGGNAAIAIDQLAISAPLHYVDGCNSSPVAVNDQINGLPNRTAWGLVTSNDSDADRDGVKAYLLTNSPDGQVTLQADGNFTFTPRPGFSGNSTSFVYKLCDNGWGTRLCSENATVKIHFPSEPVSLNDLAGLYNDGGQVSINWVTNYELNSNRFEIERSIDGRKWQTAGTVKAQGTSIVKRKYEFIDEVGRNKALKKDLYYRLKQIDDSGKEMVSRLLVVRVYNTPVVKMVSVTPNPAKNDIAVTTQLNQSSFVAMKILNADGAIVMNKALKANAGANSFIMEGSSHLQPGLYMLDVTVNSKERMMVKLIKE
jgi:stage V sporulation protein SpoVS